ncbi:MAG: hypothetical protein PF545_01920, partial [Elusimicrobia bacterium]|nr:hypothetical protein [Elusimicrobiota bacterium]
MLSKKFLKAEFIFLVIIVFLKANSYAGSKIIEQGTDFNGQLRDIMKTADGLRPENIWIKENPSFSPDARKWHEMWGDGAVSLFGGKTSAGGRKNDTYKFSEGEWTEMFPSTAPQKRSNMRVSENILFGGIDAELNCFSDTWEYDSAGEDWTEVVPSSYPSGRYEHSFAFADGKGMLFGGNPGSGYCDDTWEYDIPSSQWSYVTLSTYPSARKGASASKAAEGRIVLFGGESSQGAMAETWIYNTTGSSWTLKFPAVSPPATVNGDICYDKRNNTAVFFGGGYNSTLFNDLWVYNLKLNSWFLQYPKIPDGLPEEREMTGVAYTNSEDKFILFGGRDSLDECLGDTWSYILRSSGTYTSEVFDTGKIDTYLNYIAINTEDSVPADGEIKLQLAVSSSSLTPPSDFKGPDGTSASFYTASSTEISSGADDKRYFRYRVYLKRTIPGGTSDFYISKSEISYNHRPGPPSPVGPPFSSAGDGGIASSPLNIYWNNSADNDGDSLTYELFVSTKNNYLPLYRYRSELEELSTLSNTAVPLDHGSTYYYKIRGYDGIDYGEYSESWSVFIDTVPPLAVTYLKASRPLQNGAIKLEWTAPDTGYSYRFGYSKSLVISNETNWSSVIGQGDYVDYKPESIVSGEKDSFILTGLNEGTTYWFAVKFTDEAGNYSELSPSSYKKTNSPPEVFFTTQISGSWGTDSVADTATLVYEYFVKDPDPEDYHSYDILMAPAAGDPFDIVVATAVTQSSYSWDTRWVENADNYVVKLIASDQRGLSGSVTTSTVKISNYNEPPVINLISPSGGEIWTGLKEINWSSYDLNRTDTLYYEILISTNAGAGYVYEDRYVRDFELPYGWGTGNYPDSASVKVKVVAIDDKDLTAEDISGVFEIANTNKPPAEFDLISPQEDSFIYTTTPVFNWNPATDPEGGALTYRLTISTSPAFYPIIFEVEGITSTSKTLLEDEKLEDEKIYYWRAEALDEERSAKESKSVNRFAVDINPLEVISTFPEDGSRIVVSATETLKIQFNKLPDPRISLHKYIKITDNYGNYVN